MREVPKGTVQERKGGCVMSDQNNQGFKGVPGVPDGWELVEFRCGQIGEYVIDGDGTPYRLLSCTTSFCAIIRKIETIKKYRHFANSKEAQPFWDVALRLAGATGELKDSRFRILTIGRDGITTNVEFYSYEDAFVRFCVDDNGTPFGVEVTQ